MTKADPSVKYCSERGRWLRYPLDDWPGAKEAQCDCGCGVRAHGRLREKAREDNAKARCMLCAPLLDAWCQAGQYVCPKRFRTGRAARRHRIRMNAWRRAARWGRTAND